VVATELTEFPTYGGNGINGWATRPLYEEPVLVFGRVGQQCGNAFLTNGSAWVTDNAIVVQVKKPDTLHPQFVLDAFSHTDFARRVRHLDLPFINQSMILDTPIVLPPIALQLEYVGRLAQVQRLTVAHRAFLAHLDALFASLQHRAFRGEL
jgi:type I restriction enzyme, S subunit